MNLAFIAAAGSPGAGILSFLPFVLIMVVVYFLMLRPQMKKQKEHSKMLNAIARGDDIVTAGGIHGRVVGTNERESTVQVQIARGLVVTLERGSIARRKNAAANEPAAPEAKDSEPKKMRQDVEEANREIWNTGSGSGVVVSGARSALEDKSEVSDLSSDSAHNRRGRYRRPRKRRQYFPKPGEAASKPDSSDSSVG